MAIVSVDLALASATLAGGARLASAGGGLPQRVTTEADGLLDTNALGQNNFLQAIMFASDNSSDLIAATGSSTTKRYSGSGTSWAQVWNASTGLGRSIARRLDVANKIMIARQTAGVVWIEVDETTGVPTNRTIPSSTSVQVFMVPGGTADRMWRHAGTALLTESVISTGLDSTRTIVPATGCLAAVASNWDGTPSIYVLESATKITRYNESTLALMDTWLSAPANDFGPPGSDFGRSGIIVQSDGRLIVRSDNPFAIDRLPAVGGVDMHSNAGAERLIWGSHELGGPERSNLSGGAQYLPGFDISPNGRWICWIASTAASVFQRAAVVRNIQNQTAEWTVPLTGQTTFVDLNLPGEHGNHYGRFSAYHNGHSGVLYDYRTTRPYYQRIGLDGSPVFLDHGAYIPPGGLSLVGASALKIGVVFNRGLGKLTTAEGPYIGGPFGEGPRLWLDDGQVISGTTVYVPAGGGAMKARLGGQAYLKARMDTP
jgi:hypothetical protein